jgi:hypothetical protein
MGLIRSDWELCEKPSLAGWMVSWHGTAWYDVVQYGPWYGPWHDTRIEFPIECILLATWLMPALLGFGKVGLHLVVLVVCSGAGLVVGCM